MKLVVNNRQKKRRTNRKALLDVLRYAMTRAAARTPDREWQEVQLYLVDDADIRDVNASVFGREGVTDVITTCYMPIPGDPEGLSGEIFVNVERAIQEGDARPHWNRHRELALYVAHGCDHLSGANDDTREDRRSMRARELRWIRQMRAQHLLPDDLID
jgi:rRNA maturation RNase YbeY